MFIHGMGNHHAGKLRLCLLVVPERFHQPWLLQYSMSGLYDGSKKECSTILFQGQNKPRHVLYMGDNRNGSISNTL